MLAGTQLYTFFKEDGRFSYHGNIYPTVTCIICGCVIDAHYMDVHRIKCYPIKIFKTPPIEGGLSNA